MRTSNSITHFTHDIGHSENPKFLTGPLVLTYLDPKAELEVRCGHPANHEDDSPLITQLSGQTFQGSFFVCPGWTISGTTKLALVSGYYSDPQLNRLAGMPQLLASGGQLIYRPLIESLVSFRIPRDGDLTHHKLAAVREAEALLGHAIEPEGDWEAEQERLVLYFKIQSNPFGIQHRIAAVRDQPDLSAS